MSSTLCLKSSIEEDFIKLFHNFREMYSKDQELKVGILYSGGVDSSVLLYVANKFDILLGLKAGVLA